MVDKRYARRTLHQQPANSPTERACARNASVHDGEL